MRTIPELIELIELARADDLIPAFSATVTDEEQALLWRRELETVALPRLEKAKARLAQAKTDHDLKAIERGEWRVESAQEHVKRCQKYYTITE